MDKLYEEKIHIRNQLQLKRKAVEAVLKQYKYKTQLTHAENMQVLLTCLQNILQVESLSQFQRYLVIEDNIPIQVSFKNLKIQQLQTMLDDWIQTKDDTSSLNIDHIQSVKNRNQLFKKVLSQGKQTIDEYFTTISSNEKIKGCDLYQLLAQILTPYYLYEYNSDRQTFFEKVNSFEKFQEIVNTYVSKEPRNILKDRKVKNDETYIRKYEIGRFIQFWENMNPQLYLTVSQRKNVNEIGIQFQLKKTDRETQTQSQKNQKLNCLQVINKTLHELNGIVEKQSNPAVLQSIQRIYSSLRNEKIVLSYLQQEKHRNKQKTTSSFENIQSEEPVKAKKSILANHSKNLSPIKRQSSPEFLTDRLIKRVYQKLSINHEVGLNQLQFFLYQTDLVEMYENHIIYNLIEQGFINDGERITCKQFIKIVRELMKQSQGFNNQSLIEYLGSKDEQFRSPKQAFQGNNSNKQKTFFKEKQKKQKKRLLSHSTYQIDSQDSYV